MNNEQQILDKLQDIDNILVKQWSYIDCLTRKVEELETQMNKELRVCRV